jgi:alanine-synthesizing transaminase
MLSHRVPRDPAPNPWARRLAERRRAGAGLVDLTETNPTRVGLGGSDARSLASLDDPASGRYDPEPRGEPRARAAVAAYLASRGTPVDADAIVLTAGTSESYAHLFRLLADPGERVLVPAPSYPLFAPLAEVEGVRVAPYRLAWDGAWHLDRASLEARLAEGGARALIVVQPNHPTGSCLDADEMAFVESCCERHGLALIADEVFGDFAWPPREGAALPSFAGRDRVLTFALGGLSKCCGLPQLKLGWIAVSGPAAARASALAGLEWIADLFLTVATPVQRALPGLLGTRHAFQSRTRARLRAGLDHLARLTARVPALSVLAGQGGWAAVLRLPARRTGEEWALDLLERDVVVHPGHFYDLEGEAHLVVSLIATQDAIVRGLDAIAAVVGGG